MVFVELDAVGGEAQKVLGRGDLALLKESLEEQLKKPRGGDVKLFTQGFARHTFVEGVILVMLLETLDKRGRKCRGVRRYGENEGDRDRFGVGSVVGGGVGGVDREVDRRGRGVGREWVWRGCGVGLLG